MKRKFDLRTSRWQADIAAFGRWLEFYNKVSSSEVKDHVRERLRGIQQRWPQYIKESEIPLD